MTPIADPEGIDLPRRARRLAVLASASLLSVVALAVAWACWPLVAVPPPPVAASRSAMTVPPPDPLDIKEWDKTLYAGAPAAKPVETAVPVTLLSVMDGPGGKEAVIDTGEDGVAILKVGAVQGAITVLSIDATSAVIRLGADELKLELPQ